MLPRFFCKPLLFLRSSDPGLLRLTQATKTLLAVLIALDLFWKADRSTRLFAAMGTAFFMQCVPAGTHRRKQVTMIVAGLSIASLVGLANLLLGHQLGQDLLLVGVAALVFWVRRFLPDKNMFTLFGFTLTLIAVEMPRAAGVPHQGLSEVLALTAVLPIAFSMYFLVLPPGSAGAVEDEVRLFCGRSAWLVQSLQTTTRPGRRGRRECGWIPARLARMLSGPDAVRTYIENQPDSPRVPRLQALLREQYAALESILVLEGSVDGLFPAPPAGATEANAAGPAGELDRHLAPLAAGLRALAGCFELPEIEPADGPPDGEGNPGESGDAVTETSFGLGVRESAHLLAARLAVARLETARAHLGRELAGHQVAGNGGHAVAEGR